MKYYLLTIVILCTLVTAHDSASEAQRVRTSNREDTDVWPAALDEDYSWEYPADVMQSTKPLLGVDIPAFGPPYSAIYGDARPELGIVFRSMLLHEGREGFFRTHATASDVDWYKIDLSDADVTDINLTFYATSQYCKRFRYFVPSSALLGPLDVTDANGNVIFTTDNDLPFDLPDGYGALVKKHPIINRDDRRNYYCSPHTLQCLFLPEGIIDGGCIEGLKDLDATNAERALEGLAPCDDTHVINVPIDTQAVYYGVIWDDDYQDRWNLENDYMFLYGTREATAGTIEEKEAFWFKSLTLRPYRSNSKQTTFDCYHPYPRDGTEYPTHLDE